MLYAHHKSFLADRAISEAVAVAAGLCSESPASAAAALGMEGSTVPGDAIRIPYRAIDGQPLHGDDGVAFERFRITQTMLPPGQKPIRYMGRPSAGHMPYLPVGLREALASGFAKFLVITEGEFKALSATAAGLPTVAIPGVTMWAAPGHDGPLTESSAVHPTLIALAKVAGGAVVLADSDAAENAAVKRHMSDLAKALREQAGVPTAFTWIPVAKPKKGEKAGKMGLDDAIAAGRMVELKARLDWVLEKEKSREDRLVTGGFVPVGYSADTNIVWSVPRACLVTVAPTSLGSPMVLANLAGGLEWAEARYGRAPDVDGNVEVDWRRFAGDIMSGCLAAGPFDRAAERGRGVWRDGDDLLVSGSTLWRVSDGSEVARCELGRRFVYPAAPGIGIAADTECGSVEDAKLVQQALGTWSWQSPADSMLMLGWTCLGYLAGALDWRPHLSLTGNAGSGKSTLLRFLKCVLGGAAHDWAGGSSAAGIRQRLGSDAAVLLLDEAEADGRRVGAILEFLRNASDDKEVVMGTQDQSSRSFQLRAMGLVAGIVPPVMSSADSSRFLRLTLDRLAQSSLDHGNDLVDDPDAAREVGKRLFRRMLDAWPRFQRACAILRPAIKGSNRMRDAAAPVLAAAWVALNDGELQADVANQLAALIESTESASTVQGKSEPEEVIEHLLSCIVDMRSGMGSSRLTVATMLSEARFEALCNDKRGPHLSAAGLYGLKVVVEADTDVVLVNPKATALRSLLKDTKWASADLASLLRRLPYAERKARDPVWIGGSTCRPLALVLPSLEKVAHKKAEAPADFA